MSRPVVVLHIGAMKTGTTFLQHVMIANRDHLAAAGFPFAGETWPQQVRATQDVLRLHQRDPKVQDMSRDMWRTLVHDMLSTDGTSVMSMEFLSFADPAGVRRIKHSLAGADVHVVLTVRDAQSAFPTQWQTSITSGARHAWEPFQRGVRRAIRPGAHLRHYFDSSVRELLRTQDIAAIIRRWRKMVPADRLHVVTVPHERGDQMELWRRFCAPIGLDPDVAVNPPRDDNPSLGFASTELVRRINVGLFERGREGVIADYNRTVKDQLARNVLSRRRHLEGKPQMDAATQRAALAWNARTVRAIERAGVNLVGSLDDLPVTAPAEDRRPSIPAMPPDADLFAAAQDAAGGLVKLVNRRNRKVARHTGAPAPAKLTVPAWAESGHPSDLGPATDDLIALSRQAIALRAELFELSQLRAE